MLTGPDHVAAQVSQEMGALLAGRTVGMTEDFFLSGGDSVRAVELITRLSERFRRPGDSADELGSALLLAVFDDATPTALASIIEQHQASAR